MTVPGQEPPLDFRAEIRAAVREALAEAQRPNASAVGSDPNVLLADLLGALQENRAALLRLEHSQRVIVNEIGRLADGLGGLPELQDEVRAMSASVEVVDQRLAALEDVPGRLVALNAQATPLAAAGLDVRAIEAGVRSASAEAVATGVADLLRSAFTLQTEDLEDLVQAAESRITGHVDQHVDEAVVALAEVLLQHQGPGLVRGALSAAAAPPQVVLPARSSPAALSGPMEPDLDVTPLEDAAALAPTAEEPAAPAPAVPAEAAPPAGLDTMGELDLGAGSAIFSPTEGPADPQRPDSLPELLDLPEPAGRSSVADLPELPDLLDFSGPLTTSGSTASADDLPDLPEAPDFGGFPGWADRVSDAFSAPQEPSRPEPVDAPQSQHSPEPPLIDGVPGRPSWVADDDVSAAAEWAAEAQDDLSALVGGADREDSSVDAAPELESAAEPPEVTEVGAPWGIPALPVEAPPAAPPWGPPAPPEAAAPAPPEAAPEPPEPAAAAEAQPPSPQPPSPPPAARPAPLGIPPLVARPVNRPKRRGLFGRRLHLLRLLLGPTRF